jgi:hypothetical protein
MRSLLILFLLVFTFTKCTDLEVAPEDSFTEDFIFDSAESYKQYLAKLYGSYSLTGQDGPHGQGDISIVSDEGFTSYIRAYWKAQELTTDEAVIAWTDAGIRDLHEHSWSSENQFVRVLYYRIALIASYANDFLRIADEGEVSGKGFTQAEVDAIKGYAAEARFLRAMAYWHALDLFRNIVLETSISSGFPTQKTPQETFAFIEKELLEIEPLLPDPRQNEYGRVDKAGVWMLLAKLYLNAEPMAGLNKNTECITYCNKILAAGYTLQPNYRELFMTDNHNSKEIIFALNSDGRFTRNWGSTTFLVQGAIGGTMKAADYGVSGGWAGLRTTRSLVEKFPDVTGTIDKRAIFYTDGQSLDIEDIGTFSNGYAVPKFINKSSTGAPGSDPTHVDTDYPLFRLGDVHLMYAEAVLRGGSGGSRAEALRLVNMLRERAYGNQTGNITDNDLTLPFILDERSRELYWEATRRIDLVRFNQFTENGIWPWKGNVKEGRVTEKHRNIFPIPASDMGANPNLKQNDKY